jgi:long-chain acyl-CoA synthetase
MAGWQFEKSLTKEFWIIMGILNALPVNIGTNTEVAKRVAFLEAESGRSVCYGELPNAIKKIAKALHLPTSNLVENAFEGKRLVFHYPSNSIATALLYLTCLEYGMPLCLLEPHPKYLARMLELYEPDIIVLPEDVVHPFGYEKAGSYGDYCYTNDLLYLCYKKEKRNTTPLNSQLSLLLLTSGSTGNPKLVRLSLENILSNAESIKQYLEIKSSDKSIQSLPLHYSYGLSLLNSHFLALSTTIFTNHSFMRPEFWQAVERYKCTSFAGVPYVYETLARLRFDFSKYPSLTTLTQAGGALKPELINTIHQQCQQSGKRLFVMYGQTEATARISYVPSERLNEKIGSIGVPIPRGVLSLEPIKAEEERTAPLTELVYKGPNVMLGYADSRDSLTKGDELGGVLRTGDIAICDAEGYFFIVGRIKRITKLFGQRVSLSDVENEAECVCPAQAAALDTEGGVCLFLERNIGGQIEALELQRHLASYLQVPPKTVKVIEIDKLPRTASGKKDYSALKDML